MDIIVGGISHETNTFTPIQTDLRNFEERFYLKGSELLNAFRGTNTPIGGFIEGAERYGLHLIPTLFAEALPSAPTVRPVFDALLQEMVAMIASCTSVDGFLLDLHGSMAVGDLDGPDGIDDAETVILAAIRRIVGPDVPIVVQLDLHANVSERMVELTDVLIGRETYPEIDMADRGIECAKVLARILKGDIKPTMALHQIPLAWGRNQATAHPPMTEAIAALHRVEAQPGVICGSIATCFPPADVPDMGSSVYIVTNNDKPLAQMHADRLGRWIYERRADWQLELPPTRAVLEKARAAGKFPVVLADPNDNLGSGTPGDSTGMLSAFIEANLQDACILYIVDTEAVTACRSAGVGARLQLDVGGKSSLLQGSPIRMDVEVVSLVDGPFRYDGPMYAGLMGNMGPSACIRQEGIYVLLVSMREQPFDTSFARLVGLDLHQMRYIGLKSAVHFRAGFESWAGAIYLVGEPSVISEDNLTFRRLKRPVYPFEVSR